MTISSARGFGTPLSNTGSNVSFHTPENLPLIRSSVCVDWLQGVLKLTSRQFTTFIGEVSQTFADTFDVDKGHWFSGRDFDHHRISGREARVAWNITKHNEDGGDRHFLEEKIYDVWFRLPAKVLSVCDSYYSFNRFLALLRQWNFKPTRIDIAGDDYTKSLAPSTIRDAINSGLNHGFRRWRSIESDDGGFTLYMGSNGSDRMLRYYDKSVESAGAIDAYRFEGVFKDDYAVSVWKVLFQLGKNENCLREVLSGVLVGSVDFYSHEIEGDRNSPKIHCQWWVDFQALFDTSILKVRADRTKTTIDRACEWIEKSVETSLAMIENFYEQTGGDFFEWLNARLESGRTRLSSFHLNKVDSQIAYNYAMDGFF